ncbi:MAG: colanic acid biosynthesis glycosyltransferase WcaL [Verrucomicrobia bacterium]|nr:MAG: colanic acid biosynthesis glycosyltransferase WcaL [Verrucomicrobiota bacterium]
MNAPPDSPPAVACYCATFLKPEMWHIYRQITAVERVSPVVIAQKRENSGRFPFDKIDIVPKPALHFLRRFWFRQLRDKPWQISGSELRALLDVLENTGVRLLHIYFGHIAVHLLPLIRAWKNPSIVSFHGADVMVDMNKSAYREATRQMLDAVKLVLVRSESLRHAVVDLGCDEKKIEVQRTGIPLDEFPFRERNFPSSDGGGEWRLVQAGRLIEKKGLPVTLRAFASFLKRYPNATLTIAGEGPLLGHLQELARELKIDNRVSFTGFISQKQLRDLYYASHIFLHPSETGPDGNQEGIPNSMLEAMASGLPVFATEHGGIPEAIEHGISGVLVPERDEKELAWALFNAVEDRHFLSRVARSGAEVVGENFDLRMQARRLEDIYLKTMLSAQC